MGIEITNSRHLQELCAVCGGRYGQHSYTKNKCPKDTNANVDHTEYADTFFVAASVGEEKSQDELWGSAQQIIMDNYHAANYPSQAITKLKSQYIIQKRKV